MANHVHVLFKVGPMPMSRIVKGWKSCTARQANEVLHHEGRFWQDEYWDTFMRGAAHEAKAVRYIETNPVKAGLAREPKEWLWNSARFRDEFGLLRL